MCVCVYQRVPIVKLSIFCFQRYLPTGNYLKWVRVWVTLPNFDHRFWLVGRVGKGWPFSSRGFGSHEADFETDPEVFVGFVFGTNYGFVRSKYKYSDFFEYITLSGSNSDVLKDVVVFFGDFSLQRWENRSKTWGFQSPPVCLLGLVNAGPVCWPQMFWLLFMIHPMLGS